MVGPPVGTKVSGIITTYDRPDFLREAITSALHQSFPLFEVIIVDDCSPKEPVDIIEAFGHLTRYLRLPRNRGANAARNAGIHAARGDVIAFLDDDDEWHPSKLARQVPALEDGYEACICGWQYRGEHRPQVRRRGDVREADLRRGNRFCGTSGLVARREALLAEPFDETIPRAQEWELFVRLAKRRSLRYVPEVLYFQRRGNYAGITQASFDADIEELLRRAEAFRKHRAWLGEWHYRRLLAHNILTNISRRQDKWTYVGHAIRHSGPLVTLNVLMEIANRSRMRGRRANA